MKDFRGSFVKFVSGQRGRGQTNKQIAKSLGISEPTFYRYRRGATEPTAQRRERIEPLVSMGTTYGQAVRELRGKMSQKEFEERYLVSARTIRRYEERLVAPRGSGGNRLPIHRTGQGYAVNEEAPLPSSKAPYLLRFDRDEVEVWGGGYTIYDVVRKAAQFSAYYPELGLALKHRRDITVNLDQYNEETDETKYLTFTIRRSEYEGSTLAERGKNFRKQLTDVMVGILDELKKDKTETPKFSFRVSSKDDKDIERETVVDYVSLNFNDDEEDDDEGTD